MKQEKQDRRSQRTRQLVNSAIMGLLFEKRYDAITVQDLLDRAGIGRSTFYSHYFDKEDVLTSMIEQIFETLSQQLFQRDTEQKIVPCLEVFRHVNQNYHYFQAIEHGRAGEKLWETAHVLLSRNIEQTLTVACTEKDFFSIPLTVMSQYLAGAFLSLLKWWLAAEMPYTPEEMDQIFQQLAMPGVWATIERKE